MKGEPQQQADVAAALGEFLHALHHMAATYPTIWEQLDRARFYAATLELQWMLGGVRSGDLSWFGVHIGRARDVCPIGTKRPLG